MPHNFDYSFQYPHLLTFQWVRGAVDVADRPIVTINKPMETFAIDTTSRAQIAMITPFYENDDNFFVKNYIGQDGVSFHSLKWKFGGSEKGDELYACGGWYEI